MESSPGRGSPCRVGSRAERLGGWRVYRPAKLTEAGRVQEGPAPEHTEEEEDEEEEEEDESFPFNQHQKTLSSRVLLLLLLLLLLADG